MAELPQTDEVLFEVKGSLGVITLNRPKALNSLTLEMVQALGPKLEAWAHDDAVGAVLIVGAGEKGFCAGGDIRALHDSGKAGTPYARQFFATEYGVNLAVHRFPKPYVALIDGITMGGGVGLSVHGPYRVLTDRTVFAMPETGIGLIPDVGGSFFLPRLPGRLGLYLALTGARLRAADCFYSGVGTHYVPNDGVVALVADLERADYSGNAKATVEAILAAHTKHPGPAPLEDHRPRIDRLFAGTDPWTVMAALEADTSEWAAREAANLKQKSPTSMALSAREVHEGAMISMPNCLRMEYRIVCRIMEGHDFFEGVRAVIIDKDNQPRWNPASLGDLSPEDVNHYFADLQADELTF